MAHAAVPEQSLQSSAMPQKKIHWSRDERGRDVAETVQEDADDASDGM